MESRAKVVDLVELPPAAIHALSAGDLAGANQVTPMTLTPFFVTPESVHTWQYRSRQLRTDPDVAGWITRAIVDAERHAIVGSAGYHGPPDDRGMVEVGYGVDPAYRRRGYARAALMVLLNRAAREPSVRVVRATISPDNLASRILVLQYGFVEVGEQWDDEDGLETIFEVSASDLDPPDLAAAPTSPLPVTSESCQPSSPRKIRSTVQSMHGQERGEPGVGPAAQAAEWDARYRQLGGAMWSGRPNGRLVAEVEGITPGRGLDVGCGEGGDAIWLARHGWKVTAIDISDVAVRRARAAAELAGAVVEWVVGDALQVSLPAYSFDLVSMHYPALPKATGERAVWPLLDSVRSGGLLLAVYHDLDDEHREHMKSQGFDPEDYLGADDLGLLLGDDFTLEMNAVKPRIDPPPGTPHIADVVLRARRR